MASVSTWFRYIAHKLEYSVSLSYKAMQSYGGGHVAERTPGDILWKSFLQGKLTYLDWAKGQEMAPLIGSDGSTILVRKIALPHPSRLFVGDVVVVKDPDNPKNRLVRRLAATGGYEMVSKDEKEEPFVLDKDECWVLADNEAIKPKEAKDSRHYGPFQMSDILGRVIYCLRTAVDHGPVQNSEVSMEKDAAVLEIELDVEEMAKNHKA